eukprot:3362594-Pyramimonas_sp.AAC.1
MHSLPPRDEEVWDQALATLITWASGVAPAAANASGEILLQSNILVHPIYLAHGGGFAVGSRPAG